MGSLYTSELLPTTSEQAIREFEERYLAGISATPAPTWADELGDIIDVGAPRVTFPISLLSTRYVETREASSRFKTLLEQSFDLKVVEYDAGHEAKLMDLFLNVFAYRKWGEVPSRFQTAEGFHVVENLATLLEDTSQLSPWDGLSFFNANHKANPSGDPSSTWSNFQATPKDVLNISNITDEITLMQGVLDENGKKMNVDPTHIMVPTQKGKKLQFLLAQNMVVIGTGTAPSSNPYVGKFNVIINPQLTDADDWYLIDQNLIRNQAVPPWVVAKFLPPADLGLRFFDESSDFFKNSGKIKVSSHIWYGFKLVFPHAIRKVTGA